MDQKAFKFFHVDNLFHLSKTLRIHLNSQSQSCLKIIWIAWWIYRYAVHPSQHAYTTTDVCLCFGNLPSFINTDTEYWVSRYWIISSSWFSVVEVSPQFQILPSFLSTKLFQYDILVPLLFLIPSLFHYINLRRYKMYQA